MSCMISCNSWALKAKQIGKDDASYHRKDMDLLEWAQRRPQK